MKNKIILLFFMILLFCNIAFADSSGGLLIGEQNSYISLPQECPSCTFCYLTKVTYPNMSFENINSLMTKSLNSYNYSFNKTSTLGTYSYCTNCDVDTTNTSSCKDFEITKTGTQLTTSLAIFYGLLILFILGFISVAIIGIWKSKNLVPQGLYIIMLYILLIAFFFSIWDLAYKFTSLTFLIWFLRFCFLFLLWSFIPFLFLSFFFLITQLRKARGIQQLLEKGVPEDEAIKRIMRKK